MECANLVKSINPITKVIVGGLHASGIPEVMFAECENIGIIVVGEGELVLADVIRGESWSEYEKIYMAKGGLILKHQKVVNLDEMSRLDYTLYPKYGDFVPYVEESRGCRGGCSYCISPLVNRGRIRIRCPVGIARDSVSLRKLYGSGFHFFIEANDFGVNYEKTSMLAKLLAGSDFSWRTEARVDTFPIYLLDSLVDAGLRVLDIGLESASPEILLRMKKTMDPVGYLKAGIRLAKEVAKNEKCLLKLNIMLFYGETTSTINATRNYLRTISSICPISLGIGPVRMDPGSKMYRNFVNGMNLKMFENTFWGKVHCYPADLSREISFQDANRICMEISQEFQTSKTYYEAKRHSQLPYNMTYEKFMEMSNSIPKSERQWMD